MLSIEFDPKDIASPKRSKFGDRRAIADWYGYYAGYSVEFVRDIISVLNPPRDGLIVDPWNGSGTSTATASLLGYRSFGSDLNPVMSVLSRARSAKNVDAQVLLRETRNKLNHRVEVTAFQLPWFSEEASCAIGGIRHLITKEPRISVEGLSERDCLLLTALFGTLKRMLTPLQGTNPTWWKHSYRTSINPLSEALNSAFLTSLQVLLDGINGEAFDAVHEPIAPVLCTADSSKLPLANNSASLVVTSPPYLTRLDYVKAMLIELSLLGIPSNEVESLRRDMTGSVMGGKYVQYQTQWGLEARAVLDHAEAAALAKERSDGRYYSGTFRRYFNGLSRSLREMDRILAPGGAVAIVVQSSRHRGRIIDLPLIVQQMGESIGWHPLRAIAWPTRDLGQINPASKKYGLHSVHETAVLLRKP